MRCLVLSDIHANLAAFEAVLRDAETRGLSYDIVWCLGDVVGYGPDPNECIDLLRTLPHVCLAGNHDWAVIGKLELSAFHESAAMVVRWTQEILTPHNMNFLRVRPEKTEQGDFCLAHASPREPIWEYLTDAMSAEENFDFFSTSCCLVGHTHVPALFVRDGRTHNVHIAFAAGNVQIPFKKDARYIVNPGSVGQPRDGDPRAAYALLDATAGVWTQYRVEYPVQHTQQKMRAAGMPARLIDRLEYGR
ncbi:MAG: metallophosphoesterase family protein [Anaerolineae bacterium]|nr:metallophosphatase family protein [Thermoflexales bacterium]MDW8406798.1 metallophosphoesterase family protein [Anaerolineae bacterium]